MNTASLPIPAALLDESRMQHNIRRMQARITALGARSSWATDGCGWIVIIWHRPPHLER